MHHSRNERGHPPLWRHVRRGKNAEISFRVRERRNQCTQTCCNCPAPSFCNTWSIFTAHRAVNSLELYPGSFFQYSCNLCPSSNIASINSLQNSIPVCRLTVQVSRECKVTEAHQKRYKQFVMGFCSFRVFQNTIHRQSRTASEKD